MLGTPSRTVVGRPFVPLAEVVAVVEEHVRDSKVIIFKKRRRKNSRRLTGHRQARMRGRRAEQLVDAVAVHLRAHATHWALTRARVWSCAQQLTALRVMDIVGDL